MKPEFDPSRHSLPLSEIDRSTHTIVDLHCHTNQSPDGRSNWNYVIECASKRLHALAITDHDTVAKQGKMQDLAEDLSLLFVHGVEVTTSFEKKYPHIILLNAKRKQLSDLLRHEIKPAVYPMPFAIRGTWYAVQVYPRAPRLEAVLEWLKDNPSVLAVAAHPQSNSSTLMHKSRHAEALTSLTFSQLEKLLDAIRVMEVMNSTPDPHLDRERIIFAQANGMIGVGGSDAHHADHVGNVVTWIPGRYETSQALLSALQTESIGTAYADQHNRTQR